MVMKLQIVLIKEIPKVDFSHTYLALISLDSALKKDDSYYLQVFLKEYKYIEKKAVRHANDNFSDFSPEDNECDDEQMFLKNTYVCSFLAYY